MSKFTDPLFVDREKKYRGFQKLLLPTTRQSVMLIQSPEKMGKTWLTLKFELHCKEAPVALPVVRIDFRNPLDQLKITDHLAFIRLLRDRFNQPEYFRTLNATINQATAATSDSLQSPEKTTSSRRLAQMATEIQKVFNLSELQQLSAFLDVEFENLPGTILFDKAYGLVSHFARRGKLSDLFNMLKSERDHIDWAGQFGDLLEATASEMTHVNRDAAQESQFKDANRNLSTLNVQEIDRAEHLINEAFFDAVAAMIQERVQVVFLLDAYESAPQVAEDFIQRQLLIQTLDERLKNMVIVITGREIPDISDLGIRDLVVSTDLDRFNLQYVRDFMVSRDLPSADDVEVVSVHRYSGGVPGLLALMADQAKISTQDDDDFFD